MDCDRAECEIYEGDLRRVQEVRCVVLATDPDREGEAISWRAGDVEEEEAVEARIKKFDDDASSNGSSSSRVKVSTYRE